MTDPTLKPCAYCPTCGRVIYGFDGHVAVHACEPPPEATPSRRKVNP